MHQSVKVIFAISEIDIRTHRIRQDSPHCLFVGHIAFQSIYALLTLPQLFFEVDDPGLLVVGQGVKLLSCGELMLMLMLMWMWITILLIA